MKWSKTAFIYLISVNSIRTIVRSLLLHNNNTFVKILHSDGIARSVGRKQKIKNKYETDIYSKKYSERWSAFPRSSFQFWNKGQRIPVPLKNATRSYSSDWICFYRRRWSSAQFYPQKFLISDLYIEQNLIRDIHFFFSKKKKQFLNQRILKSFRGEKYIRTTLKNTIFYGIWKSRLFPLAEYSSLPNKRTCTPYLILTKLPPCTLLFRPVHLYIFGIWNFLSNIQA